MSWAAALFGSCVMAGNTEAVFDNSADTLDGQAKHTRVDSSPLSCPLCLGRACGRPSLYFVCGQKTRAAVAQA